MNHIVQSAKTCAGITINSLRPVSAACESTNQTIIGSGNRLSPVRRQVIIWTNNGRISVKIEPELTTYTVK